VGESQEKEAGRVKDFVGFRHRLNEQKKRKKKGEWGKLGWLEVLQKKKRMGDDCFRGRNTSVSPRNRGRAAQKRPFGPVHKTPQKKDIVNERIKGGEGVGGVGLVLWGLGVGWVLWGVFGGERVGAETREKSPEKRR